MKRISPERKASTLAKLLPTYNMTVAAVAQMEGISEATLYNWRNQAKTEGKPVPGAVNSSRLKPALPKPSHSVRQKSQNIVVKRDFIRSSLFRGNGAF